MQELIKIDNIHGEYLTTSKNIADVFGKEHKNVLQSIERLECSQLFRELNYQPTSYRNGQNKIHPMYLITKNGFVMLAMGFTGKKAVEFKEKYINTFDDMMEVVVKMHGQEVDSVFPALKFIADDLRVSDGDRILMYGKYFKGLGNDAAVKALPGYTEEKLTKPISDLLKDHGINLSAVKANKILIEHGILEIKSRRSTGGKMKDFKSLTDEGLNYGKNLISPHNQKETQPHYFLGKFADLVDLYLA